MQIPRPFRRDFIAFIEEAAVMAEGLKLLAKLNGKVDIILTLGPAGPSRTAQTAVPQTMQLLHRQLWRSLTQH